MANEIKARARASLVGSVTNNIYGDNNQIASASPGAMMNLHVTHNQGLDKETTKLLGDLEAALNKKDTTGVKKILGYIADKGVDVVLQLVTGKLFNQQ